ncbi:aminoacyl-tRNA hydrolase [Candidatus Nomurabacteria bacterium]|nr:aminoacyl-tRNA hydrolase [Candidatus Nomurabacteria bacterium]
MSAVYDTFLRDNKEILLFNREVNSVIVIGLGNPGEKYAHTRHNAGFLVLDAYAAAHELVFNERKIEQSLVAYGEGLLLAKPQTFMNESGIAVCRIMHNNKGVLVVVHDDIDIALGEVKCSFGRGSGDHNGVQSIIDQLGTKDFFRIRIGVRPVHQELLSRIAPPDGFEKFLLSRFTPMEEDLLQQGVVKAIQIITTLPSNTVEELMNTYN